MKDEKAVIDYYHTKESRWGYNLVLRGTKHFGYYPQNETKISMARALDNMSDKLGETIGLKAGSTVLNAGCGQGSTAARLAQKFGYKVEGIDLLDFNIEHAKKRRTTKVLKARLNFRVGSYNNLPFKDNYFDSVYTMETLVHSPDYKKTLRELRRVLKPGGTLVMFEYSMPAQGDMPEKERKVFEIINKGSAMHSYPHFIHGQFPKVLLPLGFKNIEVEDITVCMMPMLKKFWQLGILPYQLIKLFGLQLQFVNTTAGVELYRYRNDFRYNIIKAINEK